MIPLYANKIRAQLTPIFTAHHGNSHRIESFWVGLIPLWIEKWFGCNRHGRR